MESIAESIVRLSEQSQAIGEIIATVNDLAEQSNLLAVNAAIEATKVGEQGKGFVVVAQEIKSLATQSKEATAQVRTLLGDIQKATSAAVLATEQGNKAVEAGVKQTAEAGDSIRLLADSVNEAAQAATPDRRLEPAADGGHGSGGAGDGEHQAGEFAERGGYEAGGGCRAESA